MNMKRTKYRHESGSEVKLPRFMGIEEGKRWNGIREWLPEFYSWGLYPEYNKFREALSRITDVFIFKRWTGRGFAFLRMTGPDQANDVPEESGERNRVGKVAFLKARLNNIQMERGVVEWTQRFYSVDPWHLNSIIENIVGTKLDHRPNPKFMAGEEIER